MNDCATCNCPIRQRQQTLQCSGCQKNFHRVCCKGIAQAEYWQRKKDGTLQHWTCSNCPKAVSQTTTASASDSAQLRSCVDEVRGILGDFLPEHVILRSAREHSFDIEATVNGLLDHDDNRAGTEAGISSGAIAQDTDPLLLSANTSTTTHTAHLGDADKSTVTSYGEVVSTVDKSVAAEQDMSVIFAHTDKQLSDDDTDKQLSDDDTDKQLSDDDTDKQLSDDDDTLDLDRAFSLSLPVDNHGDLVNKSIIMLHENSEAAELDIPTAITNKDTGEISQNDDTLEGNQDNSDVLSTQQEKSEKSVNNGAVVVEDTTSRKKIVRPSAPGTPAVTKVTKSSATIQWSAPEDNGGDTVLTYVIECDVAGNTRWVDVEASRLSSMTFVVDELHSGSSYRFCVMAENSAGLSVPSAYSKETIIKDPIVRPGAPGTPVVTKVTKSSATIQWSAPVDNGGGDVLKYVIECVTTGNTRWVTMDTSCLPIMTFVVDELRNRSKYRFRVSAENSVGVGNPSSFSEEIVVKEPTEYFCCDTHGGSLWKKQDNSHTLDSFHCLEMIEERAVKGENVRFSFGLDSHHRKQLEESWDKDRKCYNKKIVLRLFPHRPKPENTWSGLYGIVNGNRLHFPPNSARTVDVTNFCPTYRQFHSVYMTFYKEKVDKVSVEMVEDVTMLERLQSRVTHPQHTQALVGQQLNPDSADDIATTSLKISLTCPIGKTRIVLPCRAWGCSHLQCIDATTVICLNEKRLRSEWKCQLCNRQITFNELRVDGLIAEILREVPEDVTEIEFRKDGSWHHKKEKENVDPDVLELSACLDYIDLTETDDEVSPMKKPLSTNINLLNQANQGSRPIFKFPNGPGYHGNTASQGTSSSSYANIFSGSPSTSHHTVMPSNNRGPTLGTNYRQTDSQSRYRTEGSRRNWSARPYDRPERHHWQNRDSYHQHHTHRQDSYRNRLHNTTNRSNSHNYHNSGFGSYSNDGTTFSRIGHWIVNRMGFRRLNTS